MDEQLKARIVEVRRAIEDTPDTGPLLIQTLGEASPTAVLVYANRLVVVTMDTVKEIPWPLVDKVVLSELTAPRAAAVEVHAYGDGCVASGLFSEVQQAHVFARKCVAAADGAGSPIKLESLQSPGAVLPEQL